MAGFMFWNKETGRVFAAGTDDLCNEKEAFTLMVDGKHNFSFESINNDIESAAGSILSELMGPVDRNDAERRTRIFTLLAALTANFIARSRVLRNSMDASLVEVIQFLSKHPDCISDFPEDDYQRWLRNPSAFPELQKQFPGFEKYSDVLRDWNTQEPAESSPYGMVDCLDKLKPAQYAVLLKARTAAIVDLILNGSSGNSRRSWKRGFSSHRVTRWNHFILDGPPGFKDFSAISAPSAFLPPPLETHRQGHNLDGSKLETQRTPSSPRIAPRVTSNR